MLVDEADNLVIFLGAGANADDREGPFQPGPRCFPDDADIAEYLAVKARLRSGRTGTGGGRAVRPDAARRASSVQLGQSLSSPNSAPGPVHQYLARLPAVWRNWGSNGVTR